jgi:hypothetical protein
MSFAAEVAGRFAREALSAGEGEVCAVFRRSFYVRCAGGRYACIGDRSLGRGPLNALLERFEAPSLGERVSVSLERAQTWSPPAVVFHDTPHLKALKRAAAGHVPKEGLGCLIIDEHNALSTHAQPALEALERWLVGNAIAPETAQLLGLGPGLTPSGDDYLGGVMVALRACGRGGQADALWRWLEPRLERGTSALSGAHLAAAAAGEAHEALHECLQALSVKETEWSEILERVDRVGHCSGWDGLAGIAAVMKVA